MGTSPAALCQHECSASGSLDGLTAGVLCDNVTDAGRERV